MIVGYHIIFGAYGFWLPNDPRGSWSDFVGSWELFRYGPATKTTETRSLAYRDHDRRHRLAAKRALQRPPVEFTGLQARAVVRGFAKYVSRSGSLVWACAVLPDHVHAVVGPTSMKIERFVIQMKAQATKQLVAEGIHPFQEMPLENGRHPKCFARGEWKVFLDPPDIPGAIQHVEDNPLKEGKRRQRWNFVVPYDG
jgi:REP element-mobilizing transposase RayT